MNSEQTVLSSLDTPINTLQLSREAKMMVYVVVGREYPGSTANGLTIRDVAKLIQEHGFTPFLVEELCNARLYNELFNAFSPYKIVAL